MDNPKRKSLKVKKAFSFLMVLTAIVALFDLIYIVVFFVELSKIAKGDAFIVDGLLGFSIAAIIINAALLLFGGIYLFLRHLKKAA